MPISSRNHSPAPLDPEVSELNDLNEPARKRILFVDDEPRVLEGLGRMLHTMRKEWDMVFSPGAEEALAAMANGPFDVIVTDMRMPGMDGADLLNEVVKRYPSTVRLVLSGQWDQQMVIRTARTAHQYLVKPCSAQDLKSTLGRIFALRGILAGKTLKRLIAGLTSLPSVSDAHRRLVESAQSRQFSADMAASVAVQDVAMTAKFLQLANSSFFGAARHVSNTTEAALHLGSDTIKALTEAPGVFSEFQGAPGTEAALCQLQRHSASAARIAQGIATMEQAGKTVIDDAFLAGFLHDIGKLVLMTMDPEIYGLIPSIVESGAATAGSVEREAFGATHAQAGAYLLWLWGLPPQVAEAVAFHHSPRRSSSAGLSAVAVVHVADALADELEGDSEQMSHLDEEYLEQMGLASRIPAWRQLAAKAAAQSGVVA